MPSYVVDSRLFADQFSTPEMRAVFDDGATVQKWLDVEAALARAEARLNIIPADAAAEITRIAEVGRYDLDAMRREMARTSHPIVPLVRAMTAQCAGEAGQYVHWGATTQDIMDTGMVLQMRDALDRIETGLDRLDDGLRRQARRHRDTPMAGRTHGQQALPITLGYKLAVWIDELRRHRQRLAEMRPRVLVGQFGGAVGTFAAVGPQGPEVARLMMADLGLGCAAICWHVARDRMAEFACTLALMAGTIGKIAHEVYSLQKTEFGELEEPFFAGKVGSSTMPHKRNPAICETIVALARAARSAVAPALEGMVAEHERDKIGLQAEREYTGRLCCLVDAAITKTVYVIDGLTAHPEAMRRNLDLTRGLLLSEAVMMRLGAVIGRQHAHEVVYAASMRAIDEGLSMAEALAGEPAVADRLSPAEVEALLDPAAYTGLSGDLVDRVLAAD